MTQNFKPGDRVRVAPHVTADHLEKVGIFLSENHAAILSGAGTVTKVFSSIDVEYASKSWLLPPDYLILVQPEAQKPAEPTFKAGDRVRVRLDVEQERLTKLKLPSHVRPGVAGTLWGVESFVVSIIFDADGVGAYPWVIYRSMLELAPAQANEPTQPQPLQPKPVPPQPPASDARGWQAAGNTEPLPFSALSAKADYTPPEVAKRRARGYGGGGYAKRVVPTDLDLPGDPY